MLRVASLIALTLLGTASIVIADDHETSTFEEFQEFGELLVGRWVGDIKFIADWPGQDLGRGERVVGYLEVDWITDKKGMEGAFVVGNTSSKDLFVWDAASKQIKMLIVDTSGSTIQISAWKKSDGVFGWRVTGGGLADGRPHGGEGEWSFSDDGKTLTIQGQTTLGDQKLDPLKDVYKRLSP